MCLMIVQMMAFIPFAILLPVASSWHSLTTDHTDDGNGYFMLVNASIQPSAFYVDTVRGLCGGSTYEFGAWIINVILSSTYNNNAIQPNLTLPFPEQMVLFYKPTIVATSLLLLVNNGINMVFSLPRRQA